MYQLTETDTVTRNSDGASIPMDEANNDYVEYLSWVSAGNTPNPYVKPVPTIKQQIATLEQSIDTPRMRREYAEGLRKQFSGISPTSSEAESIKIVANIASMIAALQAKL